MQILEEDAMGRKMYVQVLLYVVQQSHGSFNVWMYQIRELSIQQYYKVCTVPIDESFFSLSLMSYVPCMYLTVQCDALDDGGWEASFLPWLASGKKVFACVG